MDISATMAGGPEPPRGSGDLIDLIRSTLPAGDVARSITLVLGAFIVLVLAPKALLSGILPIVSELRAQPRPAPVPTEPGPREPEADKEGGREIERRGQGLRRTRERAELSRRKQDLLETYYSILELGIFEERTAVDLTRDPAGYSSIVSMINRAIAAGPSEVSSELGDFLRILERFAADRYAICDLRDYHDAKVRVRRVMRQAIEAEAGR